MCQENEQNKQSPELHTESNIEDCNQSPKTNAETQHETLADGQSQSNSAGFLQTNQSPQAKSEVTSGSGWHVFMCGLLILSVALGYTISRGGSAAVKSSTEVLEQSGLSEILGGVQQFGEPGVAVVKLYGVIQTSGDQNILGSEKGADSTVAQLKKLGKDKNVKAIVLRINSPGGTVGASQEIHSELLKLKKKGIKIVASMADVCASGGVYAAVAADKILANRGTITGSVGVIFSVSNFKQLMDKVGMRAYSIRSGKFKDIGSYSRDMTDEEQELLQGIVDSTYQQFLSAVAEGRGLKEEDVKSWADGRIFNGQQALEYKLVDRLGTFEDAVDLAHELAGIEERNIIKPRVNPFDRFESMFGSWWNGPLSKVAEQLPMTHSPLLYYYPGWQ